MDTNSFTLLGACTLARAFGYEPKIALQLICLAGGIDALFSLSEEKRDALLPYFRLKGRLGDAELEKSRRELEAAAAHGWEYVHIGGEGYPPALTELEDAPAGLYLRSATPPAELFHGKPGVAVVGTRDISPYGREWCRRIVGTLSQSAERPQIVSGLALGVDGEAHKAALETGLGTIAVMPTGPDDIYPRQHRSLAGAIASTPGCALLTDYPPGTAPTAATFLRRNRLIAGLAASTILVESKRRGGGMITARLAFGYGRDVFALPGRVDDVRSEGCNILIREKVAETLIGTDTLCEELGLNRWRAGSAIPFEDRVRAHYSRGRSPEELAEILAVAHAIHTDRGICIDDVCAVTGLPYSSAAALAGQLEADGFISIDLMQRCSAELKIA